MNRTDKLVALYNEGKNDARHGRGLTSEQLCSRFPGDERMKQDALDCYLQGFKDFFDA